MTENVAVLKTAVEILREERDALTKERDYLLSNNEYLSNANKAHRQRLDQLEAENAQLKEALESIEALPCCNNSMYPGCRVCGAIDVMVRAALEGK